MPGRNSEGASALGMLQTTLIDTRNEVRTSLADNLKQLQEAADRRQIETQKSLVDGLDRLRPQLRDTGNRVTSIEDVVRQSQRLLAELREGLRELKETDNSPSATPIAPPDLNGGTQFEPGPAAVAPAGGGRIELRPAGWPPPPGVPAPAAVPPDPGMRPAPEPALGTPGDAGDAPTAADDTFHEPEQPSASPLTGESIAAVRACILEELAPIRQELGQVREQLAAVLDTLAPSGHDGAAARRPDTEQAREHGELLQQAAQVSSALLVCHRDLWEFVTSQAGRHDHFRTPPQITGRDDGRIEAALSGRSLIAVLISLWNTQHTADQGDADWALATTVYHRVKQGLTRLKPTGSPVTITLDDRNGDGAQPESPHPAEETPPDTPEA